MISVEKTYPHLFICTALEYSGVILLHFILEMHSVCPRLNRLFLTHDVRLTSDQLFHLEKFMEKSAKQITI